MLEMISAFDVLSNKARNLSGRKVTMVMIPSSRGLQCGQRGLLDQKGGVDNITKLLCLCATSDFLLSRGAGNCSVFWYHVSIICLGAGVGDNRWPFKGIPYQSRGEKDESRLELTDFEERILIPRHYGGWLRSFRVIWDVGRSAKPSDFEEFDPHFVNALILALEENGVVVRRGQRLYWQSPVNRLEARSMVQHLKTWLGLAEHLSPTPIEPTDLAEIGMLDGTAITIAALLICQVGFLKEHRWLDM